MTITIQERAARAKLAQNYVLPNAVKLALDADVQQGHAMAIVMALFAAALVSLAQMIGDAAAQATGASWEALKFFTYAAIMLNLGGAFLSLIIIKMCSDLPLAAQQRLLEPGANDFTTSGSPYGPPLRRSAPTNTSSVMNTKDQAVFDPNWIDTHNENIPLAAAQDGILSPEILVNHFLLLESFGMSKRYRIVDRLGAWSLVAACVCTFAAFSFWTFLTEGVATAGATMVIFGSTAIIVMTVYAIGSLGQGWR
ncbi:hypothetical protein M408DRAFT_22657 [Serendipita vermifera MAFF 305830]|uniref:Uncharacterized protein n=1 Tax=Serendipita vermifera MAFF 305830 TaxID=933852 RepID=A0A0C2XLB2_SERVB|nr:hypothetical protein M408DRAFT_22657 [Serendipita vermifera MAFF 305830]